jgi:energy-coupling factor transporter ATP-binding protein EcfA2
LKGVRQFSELNISFNSGFNFIAGPNGCGKTSILAGVSHCFTHDFGYSRFKADAEFWTDLEHDGNKYRVGVGKNSEINTAYRSSTVRTWDTPLTEPNRTTLPMYQVKEKLPLFIPLFIGAQRHIKYKLIQGLERETNIDQSVVRYLGNATRSLYGDADSNIKQWLINRYFIIDKDWAREEKENWAHLIEQLPNIGPFDSAFRYLRTGRDLEPIFSIYGKECYLEEVSSGFQAVLLIIANIFQWIEQSRPEGQRLVKDASGTVLIDELDLHLHPEWQLTIRDGLARIFPKLQFIVTTHSPHLLASAKQNEVIVMPGRASDEMVCSLAPSNRSFSGWNTDQILSEIMGVKSLDSKAYEKLVSEALQCVDEKDLTGLKRVIESLRVICHPDDSMLVILTARQATLEVESDD